MRRYYSIVNIPFERAWNVSQKYSKNIVLERLKNPDIFLALGTFQWKLANVPWERSGKVLWGFGSCYLLILEDLNFS